MPVITAPVHDTDRSGRGHGAQRARDAGLGAKLTCPVILVGLMGAGKTTVGMRVAHRLQLPFVDSDAEIESVSNRSIAELFELYGEQEFRDGERRVISRLIDDVPKVIATGGGAFMNELTRALILERGLVIWLDAPIDELVIRTARRPGHRPLLQQGDPGEILAGLAALRNPIYSLAHIHVRNQCARHEVAADAILAAISQYGAPPR